MEYPSKQDYSSYKRYCKTLTLEDDPQLIEDYKKVHAAGAAWPEITQGMIDVGILDMEIYIAGTRLFMIMDTLPDFDHEKAMEAALNGLQNRPTEALLIYYQPTSYVVQYGDTTVSIGFKVGMPYWKLLEANPAVAAQGLTVGEAIVIPPRDAMLMLPVVPDKRIVINISQQRAWVYEHGALKWEWAVSTGIDDSPTWPGIYQILSHEGTAYASNWELYMPYFMGVYRPIPGSDFTNGLHGFPTRGGGQLLWESSLGRRVTYGCILLSNTNASLLYDWAENGVVVEIQP